MIIFDVDNFKNINDSYGHNRGDKVLQEISKIVTSTLRESDHVGRWGGEEFVVISTESSLEQTAIVAEKIRQSICSYDFKELGSVSCSFGVAQYATGDSYQSIIHKADTALYEAKNRGKNRVILFDEKLQQSSLS